MLKITIFAMMFLKTFVAIGCPVPPYGSAFNKKQLIKSAPRIYLVKVEKRSLSNKKTLHYFKLLEVIKYNKQQLKVFLRSNSNKGEKFVIKMGKNISVPSHFDVSHSPSLHKSNDFDYHRNPAFWKQSTSGRGRWTPAFCSPVFTFVTGETYLLFPDLMGSVAAAEIIRNKNKDKWYQYVKRFLR